MNNRSIIRTHFHDNLEILNALSDSDSKLYYKGKEIGDTTHRNLVVNSESGVHGLRFYNKKLQYYDSKWIDIATGGGTTITVDKDIILSPTANNILVKYSNGYYVPGFLISKQSNNALIKYSDGYYVPKIPDNLVTTDDVDKVKNDIDKNIANQQIIIDNKYNLVLDKINQIAGNTTKFNQHDYTGNTNILTQIIDISSLYNINSNVILNLEFMICNDSNTDLLQIQVLENDKITVNDTLTPKEVQKYKLPNITKLKFNIKGKYSLHLYVTYI